MPSLRYLDVAKNRLEALPEHPGTLVHLEVLIVKDNRIKRLPKYLAQCLCHLF